jgi:hypothetical protein
MMNEVQQVKDNFDSHCKELQNKLVQTQKEAEAVQELQKKL